MITRSEVLFALQIVTVPGRKKVLQVHALNEDRFVSRKDISVPDQVVTMVCACSVFISVHMCVLIYTPFAG